MGRVSLGILSRLSLGKFLFFGVGVKSGKGKEEGVKG